jgi:glycosyltransferase involved in cell wall biosynthesis
MKILIIGNRKHQLLYSLLKEIKKEYIDDSLVIDVFSQETSDDKYETDALYDSIFTLSMPKFIRKNRILRGIYKQYLFRRQISKLGHYDFVHIHYIEDILIRDAQYFVKKLKCKLIVSIWGSDFLRASDSKKKQMLPILKYASKITIANTVAKENFLKYYSGSIPDTKVILCWFFLEPLFVLKKVIKNTTKTDSKLAFGFSEKITIAIGYNASKMQQHLEILKAIESNVELDNFKEDIEFVLPLTYPKSTAYIQEIENCIKNSKFKYRLLTNFMSDKEVSYLRIASDVMIQLQTTDMLSASMLEHMYANNIVITGGWLPYSDLRDWGLVYEEVEEVKSIGKKLNEILLNYDVLMSKTESNNSILELNYNRDEIISKWIDLYK